MAEQKTATIVLFSGDFDKVFAAFTIAIGTLAAGMDTTMFITFWGLKAIQKEGGLTGDGLMGRMVGLMNRGGLDVIGPSKFNFGGIGRWMFKKMMKNKKVTMLPELRETMIDLGVHFLACKTSMDVMEIKREDLIDEVEGIVGAATMVECAAKSDVHFFI
jgi:peroxiredoxin family protein